MTRIEDQLERIARDLGFAIENEREFAPYRVDVYVPELHVAFEADGPMHTKPRDAKRDAVLDEQYSLIVYRVPHQRFRNSDTRDAVAADILTRVDDWSRTAAERKINADERNPGGW